MNDNTDKDKTNTINTFSRNFTKCYNGLKFQHSKNNDNNTIGTKNNNTIITNNNNTITIKNNKEAKLDKFDPLAEFEFFYDDSQNMNSNKKEEVKLNKVVINNKNNNKLMFKPKNNNNNLPVSKLSLNNNKNNNSISSPNPKLSQIQSFLNKSKNNSTKNKPKKNLNVKTNYGSFMDNLKIYEEKREKNMNNLRSISLEKLNSEIRNKPKISKNSNLLMKHIKREPLYQKKPFDEEKNLDKNFENFYSKNFNDNSNSAILKSPKMNEKIIEEKFSKFYEDNIKWKKNLEEINNNKRNNNIKNNEDKIENYTFRPTLDKNSIYIVDKLNRNRTIDYDLNNIYEYENQKELLDKMKTRLKPMLNNIRNLSISRPYINKKSSLMKRTLSDIYITKRNNNNILCKTVRNKDCMINFKEKGKKDKSKNFKENKEEEKEEKSKNKKTNKKKKGNDLLNKINKLKNEKENKQKELYKINVRQGTAWNQEVINNIIPRKKCGFIIEGLL